MTSENSFFGDREQVFQPLNQDCKRRKPEAEKKPQVFMTKTIYLERMCSAAFVPDHIP